MLEKGDAVVCDEIGEIIFEVVVPVLDLTAVEIDRVIVKARVLDEADPLSPPRRNVRTVVFVEIFAEIAGAIPDIGEVSGERSRFVSLAPVSAGTVVVVGVDVVVVDVETCEVKGMGRVDNFIEG